MKNKIKLDTFISFGSKDVRWGITNELASDIRTEIKEAVRNKIGRIEINGNYYVTEFEFAFSLPTVVAIGVKRFTNWTVDRFGAIKDAESVVNDEIKSIILTKLGSVIDDLSNKFKTVLFSLNITWRDKRGPYSVCLKNTENGIITEGK